MEADDVALFLLIERLLERDPKETVFEWTGLGQEGGGGKSGGLATELPGRPLFYIRTRWLMLWVTPEEKAAIRTKGRAPIH
jgi:hypothetical protein